MTILGAIGEIGRFETAKKLVGYAGLGSSVHASGGKIRTGAITKQAARIYGRSAGTDGPSGSARSSRLATTIR